MVGASRWLTSAALVLGFGAASLHAQHTLAAKFDLTKPLMLTGTVTQIDWANPYVHILMKVPGQPLPTLWAVEVEGPLELTAKIGGASCRERVWVARGAGALKAI